MLKDYKGPCNARQILQFLVGEKITGAFTSDKGFVVLVFESGMGIQFGSIGGECGPTIIPVSVEEVQSEVARRRAQIERLQREIEETQFGSVR